MEGLIEALGGEVYIKGTNEKEVASWCPKHEERTGKLDAHPSWSINRTTGQHHCFSCGYSGGLLRLVMDVSGEEMWDALRIIRKHGIDLDRMMDLPTYDDSQLPEPVEENPKARREIKRMVAPPEGALRKRRISEEAARKYGLLWDPDERGWVIPVSMPDGTLLGYQFKRGSFVSNRPPNMRKRYTLFGIEQFTPGERAILVESPLDVPVMDSFGFEGGLASFGVIVSDEQMRMLMTFTDEVVVALDDDKDGHTHAARLRDTYGRRMRMFFMYYGKSGAKDPGEMTRRQLSEGLNLATHSVFWKP